MRTAVEPPAGPVLIGIPFECMMEEVNFPDHQKSNEVVRAHEVGDDAIDQTLNLIAAELLLRYCPFNSLISASHRTAKMAAQLG